MEDTLHVDARTDSQSASVQLMPTGMYAVTGFDDCKRILSDWQTYSAIVGHSNMFSTFGPSPVQDQIDEIMRDYREVPVLMRSDPPAHTRVRSLVNLTFTPRVIAGLTARIEALVDELSAPWIEKGEVSFVEQFAGLLPNAVTTGFLGCPDDMRGTLRFWAHEIMSRLDGPQSPERQLAVAHAIADMARYFHEAIADRRRSRTDDLISLLAHAEIDGDRLANEAIINVIVTFMVGGHETTTFLLGYAFWRLANDRGLTQQLRQNRDMLDPFIEEILRLASPAQAILRSPTRDVEVGGVAIPAGAMVLVSTAAANRDPRVFSAPDELQVERFPRSPGNHLAFGHGAHTCIGMNLAKAEVRITLQRLLPRMLDIAPAGESPIAYFENFMLRGPSRLELSFTPN